MPTGIYIRTEETCKKMSDTRKTMIGDKSPRWKGGECLQKGYIHIKNPGDKRYRRRSHVIVENILGRILKKSEIVHHIDENKTNDKVENLFIFRHQSAHKRWHHFLQRHSLKGEVLTSNLLKV